MSSTSGGTGKNDDSAKASTKSAKAPHFDSLHESTQSYRRFTKFIIGGYFTINDAVSRSLVRLDGPTITLNSPGSTTRSISRL